jgi:hypothetical protein
MKYLLIVLILIISVSCTLQKEAFVFVDNRESGRTGTGEYYLDVTVKNTGEQPAYFVILISEAYLNGNMIQRIEKGYGDIFPGASKKMRMTYDKLGLSEPDSVSLQITYSPFNQ